MASSNIIEVKNLAKSFGEKAVIIDVSFTIKKGESFTIIGGSGSGKSVICKMIMGLIKPTSGQVKIHNHNMHFNRKKDSKALSKIGVLFQGGALFDSLRIWENISFSHIHNNGVSSKEAKLIAVENLEKVGLNSNILYAYPAELSGGMQKRVALARAIATKPDIIFFDEPTTGLDPVMTNVINDLIKYCSKELGATTVTISHDMQSIVKMSDTIAMLHNGSIIWQGAKNNLLNSNNIVVENFVNGVVNER